MAELPEQIDGLDPSVGSSTLPFAASPRPEVRLSEKEAKKLKDRVMCAIRYRDKEYKPKAERAMKLYMGEHWPNMRRKAKKARPVRNYVRGIIDDQVARTAFSYPEFSLRPMNEDGRQNQENALHLIRYDWRQADAQREAKRAKRDERIYGVGIVFDSWLWETKPEGGKQGKRVEGERRPIEGEEVDATPSAGSGELPVPRAAMLEDRPLVRRLCPLSFFVDPECDSVLENARFCGFEDLVPLEDVKAEKRYRNTRQLNGTAKNLNAYLDDETKQKDEEGKPADVKRVLLYHVYDRLRRLHIVLCEEHDKELLAEEWTWEANWYPFSVLRVPDQEECFWPTPPPIWIEDVQHEINESRAQMSEIRRKCVPRFWTASTLEEEQKQLLGSDQIGAVLENVPAPGINPLPAGQVQQELYASPREALGDLQFIMGVDDYATATPPTKRMTSAEVEAVKSGVSGRAGEAQQAYEMFCAEIARHLLGWERQYAMRSRTLPIYDQDGQVTGIRDFRPEEITGEFDIEVYVGSTSAPNRQGLMEQYAWIFQSIPNFVQAAQMAQALGWDLKGLFVEMLKQGVPDLRNVDRFFQELPQQPMMPGQEMMGAPNSPGMPEGSMQGGDPMAQLAAMMGGGMGGQPEF